MTTEQITGIISNWDKIEADVRAGIHEDYGKSKDIQDILDLILKAYNSPRPRIVFDPTKPSTIPRRCVDVSKAEKILGFKTKVSLQEGIRRTIDGYRSLKNGK